MHTRYTYINTQTYIHTHVYKTNVHTCICFGFAWRAGLTCVAAPCIYMCIYVQYMCCRSLYIHVYICTIYVLPLPVYTCVYIYIICVAAPCIHMYIDIHYMCCRSIYTHVYRYTLYYEKKSMHTPRMCCHSLYTHVYSKPLCYFKKVCARLACVAAPCMHMYTDKRYMCCRSLYTHVYRNTSYYVCTRLACVAVPCIHRYIDKSYLSYRFLYTHVYRNTSYYVKKHTHPVCVAAPCMYK